MTECPEYSTSRDKSKATIQEGEGSLSGRVLNTNQRPDLESLSVIAPMSQAALRGEPIDDSTSIRGYQPI